MLGSLAEELVSPQPMERTNRMARPAMLAIEGGALKNRRCLLLGKWLIMVTSWCPPLLSAVPPRPDNSRVPGGSSVAWRDNCARRQENPGGWRHRGGRHTD